MSNCTVCGNDMGMRGAGDNRCLPCAEKRDNERHAITVLYERTKNELTAWLKEYNMVMTNQPFDSTEYNISKGMSNAYQHAITTLEWHYKNLMN